MMKRITGKMKSDNRGSTIIIVLVTMTFLTVLASVLLYLSLVNLQMKKLDKAGKINFYSAEAVMNEIRAGVQEAVSDAIKKAYTDVLVSYNKASEEAQTANFRNLFFDRLYNPDVGAKDLFTSEAAYDPAVLESYVSAGPEAVVGGSGDVVAVTDGVTGNTVAVIVKDVFVRYITNGYETTVSSDITIQAPLLLYTEASGNAAALHDFTVVARGTLRQPEASGTVGVYGNVYAGGVTVSGGGNVFNVQNAPYFVSGGPVNVSGGRMTLNINSSLWARDIKLDAGGSISIAGDAYIANDLNLFGNDTRAVLSGRYYGYGNSGADPNNSSSIIINGRNTVLDMSALRALMLAGSSFVNFGTTNGYVMMGESVSAKSNQLAYLVPDSCLTGGITNPYQYPEGADPGNEFLQTKVLLNEKIMNDKTLADYGIVSTANNIKYLRKTVGSTHLIYFCLNFSDQAKANAYFKDYYDANSPTILKYLDIYSNGISLWSNATKNLAGQAFTFDGSTLGAIIDATNIPTASINEISSSYLNLCVTLSRTVGGGGAATAYDHFINADDISALTGSITYQAEGGSKAVVTNGDYVLNADLDNTVHVVIATGNVTVSGHYSGLILAGGDVTLLSGSVVSADRSAVSDALQSLLTEDGKAYRYLNPQVMSPMNATTSQDGTSEIWDMNNLVTFANWKKNEI